MKIAIVSTAAVAVPPRAYGGTEQVVHDLTEGLVRDGHDVTLFATGDSRTSARLRALYRKAVWPVDVVAECVHAAWAIGEIAKEPWDVVHVHQPVSVGLAGLVAAPVVYTVHHAHEAHYTALYRRFSAVHYVAISRRQRECDGALRGATVIHHGVDPARCPFVVRPADYVAFIGRFAPEKAPHLAIDAARAAGVPLRLAGCPHPGEGEAYHAREIVPRLRGGGATWVGEVSGARKGRFLGRARAMLLPSCWEEPFGLVTVESLLAGTPVIAFARGAAPEIVEDGVTGFLVDDVAGMAAAIAKATAIDRARCRARAVERFGATRMVRDYERLYALACRAARGRVRGPRARVAGDASRASTARAIGGSGDKRRRRVRQPHRRD